MHRAGAAQLEEERVGGTGVEVPPPTPTPPPDTVGGTVAVAREGEAEEDPPTPPPPPLAGEELALPPVTEMVGEEEREDVGVEDPMDEVVGEREEVGEVVEVALPATPPTTPPPEDMEGAIEGVNPALPDPGGALIEGLKGVGVTVEEPPPPAPPAPPAAPP